MLYNIRKFHYVGGTQIRLYKRPVKTGEKKEVDLCDTLEEEECTAVKLENRTEEQKKQDAERSLFSSMNRSKQMIYGIARSNEWDYFLTLTFDRHLVDSSNYKLVAEKARKWLNNIRSRTSPGMKYLIVPELHSDGLHWHLHGLLADCPELTLADSGHTSKSGLPIYNLQNWKYGFSTVTKVTHNHKVSAYISKYITKELADATKGRQRYWASNNVIRPMQLCEHDLVALSQEELLKIYAKDANHISERSTSDGYQRIIYIETDSE